MCFEINPGEKWERTAALTLKIIIGVKSYLEWEPGTINYSNNDNCSLYWLDF